MQEAENHVTWLTTSAVARRLGRSESEVRRLANRGELRSFRLQTGTRLFDVRDVEAFARGRE